MGRTVAQTIREITRVHLQENRGLFLGQCVTAVGWVGGTVPELTEEEGIVELPAVDAAGPGIAVGAALAGRRPIYTIRYQGFMWYNAAPLLNYAAKSKELWGVPCPLLVRSIAMEGGIGPVATACHHAMVMHMPGMPVAAPMTPGEWRSAWEWFMSHDDPLYVSEHRRSFAIDYEMEPWVQPRADVTLLAISAGRLNALEAVKLLHAEGITANLLHVLWLKPFSVTPLMREALRASGLGVVIDSDFEIAGASRSLAYELMHETGVPVHALGLEDRTAGFAPQCDNPTPPADKIVRRVKGLLGPGRSVVKEALWT